MDKLNEKDYKPHPKLVRALDILFILHAEHELNCSTASVRHLSSSGVDAYSCIAGSATALYGPKVIFFFIYLIFANILYSKTNFYY